MTEQHIMPSFADSFWTEDLLTGVTRLFEELHKGCNQNVLFIQLFASRMQFEVNYGRQLCKTTASVDGLSSITGSDLSLDVALNNIAGAMEDEGNAHLSIAAEIETTILRPFSAWCEDHEQRVNYSEKTLVANVSNYLKSKKYVEKLEQVYFSKCRQLEDHKRSNFNDDELKHAMEQLQIHQAHESIVAKEREYETFGRYGNIDFDVRTMRETIKLLLTKLEKTDYKVPIINYRFYNTNNGSEIVKFLMENLALKDLDQAEMFGQDLLNAGFIKYCNGVGTTFVNSKKFQYNWKPYAYKFAQIPQPNANEISDEQSNEGPQAFSDYFTDLTTIITHVQPTASKSPALSAVSNTEKTLFKLAYERDGNC